MCRYLLQVQLALKAKGLRDDITVLVIDALPYEELRTPPALQRRNGHPTIARWALGTALLYALCWSPLCSLTQRCSTLAGIDRCCMASLEHSAKRGSLLIAWTPLKLQKVIVTMTGWALD